VLLEEFPTWLFTGAAIVFGLCWGSFLNVVIYRLPRGLSLSRPGSRCPSCETPIAPYDNVPVLGWLLLRGRSRCCKTKISIRYPAVELLGGLLAGAIFEMRLHPHAHELLLGEALLLFSFYLALGLGLIALALIDLEHMILPDSITWGGALLGLLSSPFRPEVSPEGALLGGAVGFFGIWFPFIWLHEKLRGFPGMGLGDAKLMTLAGTWFGPLGALLTLFLGAFQGTLFALITLGVKGEIEEPEGVRKQREELLAAIDAAHGQEKEDLLREYEADPLAKPPEERKGGAHIAFGPFLALALVELLLLHDLLFLWLRELFVS
jgi:leader peptidase (prepilin peptidase) / N-methyltransferase